MQKKIFIVLLVVAGSSPLLGMSQTKDSTKHSSKELSPIEVRALRVNNISPFVKTDISATDIAKQNIGQDLPILLQFTPSAVATSDAGAGIGYTGLRVRGVDATRMNVTLNGIPVNDPEEQGAYFVDIPDIASSTGSVQLQRGVGTSTNGAGAFGATMSISNMQQADSASAAWNSSIGSFNTIKNTLTAGTGLLKNGLQVDVRLSQINSDGYIQRSATELRSMQIVAGWKASERTTLHAMLTTGKERTGQAWNGVPQDSLSANRTYNGLGLKADGTYYNNQTDNYQQDYYQLFADHVFSKHVTTHVGTFMTRGRGYYEEYKLGESYAAYGLPNVVHGTDTMTTTDLTRQLWLDNYYYGTVFSLLYNNNKGAEVTVGGSYTQFNNQHYGYVLWAQNGGVANNYQWYKHNADKSDYTLYVKAQQKLGGGLYAFGDVQIRGFNYKIDGFDDNPNLKPNISNTFFNPKAGLSYMLKNTGTTQEKIYASIAVAHKEPTRYDYEAAPDNLPKPETLYDAEAGYENRSAKYLIAVNLYYMSYKDQLVLTGQVNSVGAYPKNNVPNSYRAGIELQAAYSVNKWLKAGGNFTFSQNKIADFTEYVDDYDNGTQRKVDHGTTDIAFSPNETGSATITLIPVSKAPHGQHVEIDIMDKYVGKQYLDNTSNNDRVLKAYNFCNVLLRYTVHFRPFKELIATVGLNNIFSSKYENNGYTYSYYSGNQLYTDNAYFPQAGFHYMAGLSMKW